MASGHATADEFVERAVVLLHEQESWLAENASQIDAKIRESYATAQPGELLDAESVCHSMDEKKRAWLPLHASG